MPEFCEIPQQYDCPQTIPPPITASEHAEARLDDAAARNVVDTAFEDFDVGAKEDLIPDVPAEQPRTTPEMAGSAALLLDNREGEEEVSGSKVDTPQPTETEKDSPEETAEEPSAAAADGGGSERPPDKPPTGGSDNNEGDDREEVERAPEDQSNPTASSTSELAPRPQRDPAMLSPREQHMLEEVQAATVTRNTDAYGQPTLELPFDNSVGYVVIDDGTERSAHVDGHDVNEALRGFGIGTRLMEGVAVECVHEDIDRVEGLVISTPALRSWIRVFGEEATSYFYQKDALAEPVDLPMTHAQALQSIERSSERAEQAEPGESASVGVHTQVDIQTFLAHRPEFADYPPLPDRTDDEAE